MKKIALVLIIVLLGSVSAYSLEFWIGGNAYLNMLVGPDDFEGDVEDYDKDPGAPPAIGPESFSYGAEARLYLGPLMANLGAVYMGTGDFLVMADIGLTLKLLILRGSLGIGPNFGVNVQGDANTGLGFNLRATTEIELGPIAFGLSYIAMIQNLSTSDIAAALKSPYGLLGVNFLIRL